MTDERRGARRDAGMGEGEGRRQPALALAPFTAADPGQQAELDCSESVPVDVHPFALRMIVNPDGIDVLRW